MDNYLPFEEVRQAPEFAAYYEAAGHFCLFLEESNGLTTSGFLNKARLHLLRLYAAALAMPAVDLQSNKEYEDKVSVDAFRAVLSSVAEQLDSARYYWHVFDPTDDLDTTPKCGDLLNDLGDIYKDLKNRLMLFSLDKEDCEEIARWNLKFDFDAHWGAHCINALSAMHFYLKK
ncbi:DUF5063 domain-containing protein [Hymenobacter sp. H14-R3]|uniref:DUF5063 domain-containing protein n=1 Tax=Hymenobacter sp. H14-R3 TaxID=3046308 RepID=UPI0024B93BBC|nr:DUF5063 domain-containing protein [Hymenobacter sp. H14-R3]MDJ0363655.1 DUF5063 domain-containing protein [Hymenobacter sp. H14-R3]